MHVKNVTYQSVDPPVGYIRPRPSVGVIGFYPFTVRAGLAFFG